MTTDKAKLAYIFLNNYSKLYENKYGKKPNLNKYKEKWATVSLIDDYTFDEVERVLSYYFTLKKEGHPLMWFYNNFDMLIKTLNDNDRDKKIRLELRKETARLREEYLNGNA